MSTITENSVITKEYVMEVRWGQKTNSEIHHCENDKEACSAALSLAARYPLNSSVDIYRKEDGKKIYVNTASHNVRLLSNN